MQGAAEIVLTRCSHFIGAAGITEEMTEAKLAELTAEVTQMASQGLRTLCLTCRDFPPETDSAADVFDFPPEEALIACCLVGIKARRLPCSGSSGKRQDSAMQMNAAGHKPCCDKVIKLRLLRHGPSELHAVLSRLCCRAECLHVDVTVPKMRVCMP